MFGSAAGGGVRAKGATVAAVLLVAAGVAVAAVLAGPAWAETLTVTNTDDSGAGSLRQAIADANADAGEDAIGFAPSLSGQTIALSSQLPAVTDGEGLTVDGTRSDVTISGAGQVRVFKVNEGAMLALIGLTVADGDGASGPGGGVLNLGTLRVTGSTLSGNAAPSGGAISNSGSATVTGSTLSGNTASDSGGGIHNLGTLRVTGSTLSNNSAASGGGVEHAGGSATLRNTIVANSTSGGNCNASASPITDGGYNLDSDDSCGFTAASSRPGVANPGLGPLDDNGGPTQTHALAEDSQAVDRGRAFGSAVDQRGLPRPTDLGPVRNASGGDGSDIGAYEQVRCSGGVVNAAGTIIGTAGNDSRDRALRGTPGDDFIFGLGGNDEIFGGGGNDEVCSGKGNDRIEGGDGDDTLLGGEGKDKLWGDGGDDCLEGLLGDDRLNTVDRVRANDRADGGSGQDAFTTDSKAEKARCRP
jgi:hypothetical protein